MQLLGHLAWPFVLSPSLCHCWGSCSGAQKWWLWSMTWGCKLFSNLPGTLQSFPSLFPTSSAQVANVDVGWTLGCMLNLTNIIPSEPLTAVTELPRSIWIATTVLLAIMLILTFCLLTAMCYQRNSSGYEQL